MNHFAIRAIFYLVSTLSSVLICWSISQLIYYDVITKIVEFIGRENIPFIPPAYAILLTIVTPGIAASVVITELYLSHPTRYKANWQVLARSLLKRIILMGILVGVLLSLLNAKMLSSSLSAETVRVLTWTAIGVFVGIAEGTSWSLRSIEGTIRQIIRRVTQSVLFGATAGTIAALCVEAWQPLFGFYSELIGFILFGSILGLLLCFASRPNYQMALRAGQGFEALPAPVYLTQGARDELISLREDSSVLLQDSQTLLQDRPIELPRLQNNYLRFIPDLAFDAIEEGLSIRLPNKIATPIAIGSSPTADIYIPDLPEFCAALTLHNGVLQLRSLVDRKVQLQQKWIPERHLVTLRHNQILTLYHDQESDKFYRFVIYDRFLDPQA